MMADTGQKPEAETRVPFSFHHCSMRLRQSADKEACLGLVLEVSVQSGLVLLLWGLG